jgi:hypothetical protein
MGRVRRSSIAAAALRRPLPRYWAGRWVGTAATDTVPAVVFKNSALPIVLVSRCEMLFRGLDIPRLFVCQKDKRNVIC